MICITGASGTLGSEIVRQLQADGIRFRASYASSRQADAARARGIESVQADYRRPETLHAALRGCSRLFLLGPNLSDQTHLEANVVEAARTAGVGHIVKQSVMGATDDAFSLAQVHRPVEKAIAASGLAWTFLRPNSFMQNIVTYMGRTIATDGLFYSATGQAAISHIDVRDIAAVAVRVLTEPGHEGEAYTLTGPEALSYDDLASELSRVLNRTVGHVSLPPEDLAQAMRADGMTEPIVARMLDLERYYREGRASIVTGDVRKITGHEPRPFLQYAYEHARLLSPAQEHAR